MDEVLAQLNSTVIDDNNEQNKSVYDEMYKNWGRLGNQDQRRRDILDIQKSNRNSKIDTCRGILNLVESVKQDDLQQCKAQGSYSPSIYVSGFTKAPGIYRDVLMISEWMIGKPDDFEENWYVVPCPKGLRTLVVASQGNTKCYNKFGFLKKAYHTALPGGNPYDLNFMNHCVILDCFLVEGVNTLYVLDVLAWNSQPMTDGETDFRYYWVKSHVEDIPELKSINKKNKIKFEVLPKYDCDTESFNKFMMTCPYFKDNSPFLDGLLFYHKMGHYVSGSTPLVGWLYPFMVNEVLGSDVTVNPVYNMNKPADYVNQDQFITDFENKTSKKAMYFKKPSSVVMNTSTEGENGSGDKKRRQRKHKNQINRDADMEDSNETTDATLSRAEANRDAICAMEDSSETKDASLSAAQAIEFTSKNSFLSRVKLIRTDLDPVKPSTDTTEPTC